MNDDTSSCENSKAAAPTGSEGAATGRGTYDVSLPRPFVCRPLAFLGLALSLCIPLFMIWGVIREREERANKAEKSIRSGWGQDQAMLGPFLVIPFSHPIEKEEWTGYADQRRRSLVTATAEGRLCVTPTSLNWHIMLIPIHLRRGLFSSVVYQANLKAEGVFDANKADLAALPPGAVLAWEKARLVLFFRELDGIERPLALSWGDNQSVAVKVLQEERLPDLSGLEAETPWSGAGSPVKFSLSLYTRGSGEWAYLPVGRQTELEISSPWPDPSFGGDRLPSERLVNHEGFRARWTTTPYASKRPAAWVSPAGASFLEGNDLKSGRLSVRLEPAVGPQRMAERAVKYGFLFVGLVLGAVAAFDMTGPRLLRGVHYLGVGIALCLFFLALLALHEIWSFAFAYWCAVALSLGSIATFCAGLLGSQRRLLLLTATLCSGFVYLFVMLRLEDYALLAGTLALFLALGLAMRLIRRLD